MINLGEADRIDHLIADFRARIIGAGRAEDARDMTRRRDETRPVTDGDPGSALREATATLSGPQLRELSRQRNEVIRALVRQARRLAADAGQPVSEDVARGLEETLNAALADPAQAELLLQGRLSVQLKHSGYGPAEGPSPPGGKPPAAPAKAKKAAGGRQPSAAEQRRAERRDQLEPGGLEGRCHAEDRDGEQHRRKRESECREVWSDRQRHGIRAGRYHRDQ